MRVRVRVRVKGYKFSEFGFFRVTGVWVRVRVKVKG